MTRFYIMLKISFNFKITQINSQLTNLYMKNIPHNVKNVSVLHLSKNPNDEVKPDIEQLNFYALALLKILKAFESNYNRITKNTFYNALEKKIFLLNYMEHCIVRPSFLLINFYILNISNLKGGDSYNIYEICFYFLKNIVYFYQNLNSNNNYNMEHNNMLLDESKDYNTNNTHNAIYDKKLLLNNDLFDFENIYIKNEIDLSLVEEVYEDSLKFAKNVIKYFELDKIHNLFFKNLEKILKVNKKSDMADNDNPKVFTELVSMYKNFRTKVKTEKVP